MASRFDFYSFLGYELLISGIRFLLVTMAIFDISNYISTCNNVILDINNVILNNILRI